MVQSSVMLQAFGSVACNDDANICGYLDRTYIQKCAHAALCGRTLDWTSIDNRY